MDERSHGTEKFRKMSMEKQGGKAFGFRKTATAVIETDGWMDGYMDGRNWPISKRRLLSEHSQLFHKFIHEISLEQLNEVE
jgi:hypothetical protein